MAKHWENKTIVVAGGSSGLGFAIARAFYQQGAFVVLLARTETKLTDAVESLERSGLGVGEGMTKRATGFSVDLADTTAVKNVVEEVVQLRGGIDVWVNAVGQSTRVNFSEATLQNYRELMDQNFFTVVNGTYAVLELLDRSKGHLVNIGSLASKTAWPYMSPYVTSKHALAGFTNQLRLEGPKSVHYLFVCPGPIAAQENSVRYETADGMSEKAAQPGAGAPVKLIDPDWLATKIVAACEKRKPELVVPAKSRILFGLLQLWPRIGNALLNRIAPKA